MDTIEKDIDKIKEIIAIIKPQYTTFGGDIEFVDIKGKDVLIRPTGYCWRWHVTRMDLVRAIQEKIKEEIPWVEMVLVAPQKK